MLLFDQLIFLDSKDKVNSMVELGIMIYDTFTLVLPLVTPAKKITIFNTPISLKMKCWFKS